MNAHIAALENALEIRPLTILMAGFHLCNNTYT